MKKLAPVVALLLFLSTVTPLVALTHGLAVSDFEPSRKVLVEIFIEPN